MQLPDRCGRWEVEADLATVAQWQPALEQDAGWPPPQAKSRRVASAGALLLPLVGTLGSERLAMAETFVAML
jgi:hypothetical protein